MAFQGPDSGVTVDSKMEGKYSSLFSMLGYVDTRYFASNLKVIKEQIADPNCPHPIVLMVGYWLFNKIYTLYKVKKPERPWYSKILIPAIEKEQFNIISKSNYLRYLDGGMMAFLAEHFYFHRFPSQFFLLQMFNDVTLIQYGREEEEMKSHFLGWIRKAPTYLQQCNLLDVLIRYFPKDPDVKKVRAEMEEGRLNQEQKDDKPRNLYTNEQNAHDEDISEATLLAVDKLLAWHKKNPFIDPNDVQPDGPSEYDMMYQCISRFPLSENILVRAKIDTTAFPTENFSPHIMDVLIALVRWIEQSESKEELYKRLIEEFAGMDGLCSSGYINRFISVLQGFSEEYTVTIPFAKQLQARLTHEISKQMNSASDLEMEGSYDPKHRSHYLGFLARVFNACLPAVIQDYGAEDVEKDLAGVVEKIAGSPCVYRKGQIVFTSEKGSN